MAKFGKERFPNGYQNAVGWGAAQFLHQNSKELVQILVDNKVLKDGLKIFEIGAGGGRNLKYIWDKNKKVKLYLNDLFKEASMNAMHQDIRDLVTFYELDTLSLFKDFKQEFEVDLLISSDHLMHVEYESVEVILEKIRDSWKPNYILMRELKKEFETPEHPRLFHNYDMLEDKYEVIVSTSSKQGEAYFIKLYRRKND